MPVRHYSHQVRKNPKKALTRQEQWSDSQKLEAVTTYLMVGNMVAVSAALNIPVDRLRHWKQLPWWKEYEQDIRRAHNLEVSGKLQKIINKSSEVVLDRLENGDLVFNPHTGKMGRKAVNAKVASDILTKSIDKDILLQKLDVAPEAHEEEILDRLAAIQATLRQNARKPITVEAEIVDAQLSEGEPIQSETGANQSTRGAQQGARHDDESRESA